MKLKNLKQSLFQTKDVLMPKRLKTGLELAAELSRRERKSNTSKIFGIKFRKTLVTDATTFQNLEKFEPKTINIPSGVKLKIKGALSSEGFKSKVKVMKDAYLKAKNIYFNNLENSGGKLNILGSDKT